MEEYLSELESIFKEIDESKLAADSPQVDELLKEAATNIRQIGISIHTVTDKKTQDSINAKVAVYDERVRALRKSALVTGGRTTSQPQKPVSQEEKQQQSMEKMREAHRELQQTEAVGQNILKNLAGQSETIDHSLKNVKETNQHLSYSKKIINGMNQWWR